MNFIREFEREHLSDELYAGKAMRVLHRKPRRAPVYITTETLRAEVKRLLRLRLTNREIARRTGLSATSVSRIKAEVRA